MKTKKQSTKILSSDLSNCKTKNVATLYDVIYNLKVVKQEVI